jgi:hypothetical protein
MTSRAPATVGTRIGVGARMRDRPDAVDPAIQFQALTDLSPISIEKDARRS